MAKSYEEELLTALKVIEVELKDEFDRNFERKAFFDKRWKPSKHGLIDTGELRRSIGSEVGKDVVTFYSDKEYAAIHNDGGRIQVTAKMHGFFWHKFKETHQRIWEALGKKKVGSYIEIPQRQFIGEHKKVDEIVDGVLAKKLENNLVERICKK